MLQHGLKFVLMTYIKRFESLSHKKQSSEQIGQYYWYAGKQEWFQSHYAIKIATYLIKTIGRTGRHHFLSIPCIEHSNQLSPDAESAFLTLETSQS